MLLVLKIGILSDDFPARLNKSNSDWMRFNRWRANGVWDQFVGSQGEPDLDEVQFDSTSIKAHSVASMSRRRAKEKKMLT